jgi:hypothetical protein
MSQFRQTGNGYASQWDGDDLNAGTDPTLPKKNISAFASSTTNVIVVGPGYYKGSWVGSRVVQADGKVIVDGLGGVAGSLNIFRGCHVRNFSAISNAGASSEFTDSIVESVTLASLRGFHTRSIFLSNIALENSNSNIFIDNCIFITPRFNSTTDAGANIRALGRISYGYIAAGSKIFLSTITVLTNNLINGLIRISGVDYEAKFLIDGSPRPDADPLIADIATIRPTFYTDGNFACLESDIKFIDIISRTVEPDSILLQKSNANGFIGGVKVGKKIDLDESGFTITKTGIDDSNPNFWKIASGVTFAKIRITGKVSDSLISGTTLDIRIPFNFDGDSSGNTATNNNVPDAWNERTTPDTKGTKPNRLTFEVRTSKLASPGRDVSADWDNDNTNSPSIAGQYYLTEWGQPMLHHVISGVSYGNADANAINAATKLPFNFRSIDVIITITNTREI